MRVSGFVCPACGFPDLDEPPRSPTGGSSYEICPSCGFEFGVTDDDLGYSYLEWRERWLGSGARWTHGDPPAGWDPRAQLTNIADR